MGSRRRDPRSPRALAVRVLRDVQRQRAFSNRVLSRHLERVPELDPRDRGLVTTLTYGVLRHRTRLDAHIDAHARRPAGLRGEVRDALRVAAYEILELGRPGPIARSEATRVVRTLDPAGSLGGVVQAIVAAIERNGAELDAALDAAADLDVLERRWSIPRWLAGRWLRRLGPERARRRAAAFARVPSVDLRVDLGRATADAIAERLRKDHPGIVVSTVPDQPQALRIRGGGDVFHGPLHAEGLISVQGLAAQQPALCLAPEPGTTVLDACAGMGVKTLQLAEIMQRRGRVVAADLDPRQLEAIDEIRSRGRLKGSSLEVEVCVADLAEPDDRLDATRFDAALLDVPCTGLGNLARHPEIRWHRSFEDIGARAELQRRLLARNLARVRPGGALVYAVCSPEPEEGPEIVHTILATGLPAELQRERTFTPEDDDTEGFYMARIRRID